MKTQVKIGTPTARAEMTEKLASDADLVLSREQVELVTKSAADCIMKLSNRCNGATRARSASTKKVRREAFMRLRMIVLKKDGTQLTH